MPRALRVRIDSAWQVLSGTEVVIGRSPYSTICVSYPKISRIHASFYRVGDRIFLRDLGSTNGTFIDGVRIGPDPVQVAPGASISLGGVQVFLEEVEIASTARRRTNRPDGTGPIDDTDSTQIEMVPSEAKR